MEKVVDYFVYSGGKPLVVELKQESRSKNLLAYAEKNKNGKENKKNA